MKRLAWCALLPLVAFAATSDDYARQWPLILHDDGAGAYRVALDREIYRSAQSPSLRDVDVVNADGQIVPSALFSAEQPLARSRRYIDLPWFPLPAGKAAQAQDIAVISERDADGGVRRVETHISGQANRVAPVVNAWLVDASRLRENIVALDLAWPAAGSALDTTYRVEGSDDLRQWRVLQSRAQLLDLTRGAGHLLQQRIALEGTAKYLRLLPAGDGTAPVLSGVRAELAPAAAELPWAWELLPGLRGKDKTASYTFELHGRFPIARADVVLPGNSASQWTLQSRDGDDAPWQTRAGPWMAYRIGAMQADRSAAQALDGVTRDRHWRLSSSALVEGTPALRLGYRPEVMVFVAQGLAPYALVAGSARATRAPAPIAQLIGALRTRHGGDWQPAGATMAPAQILAGDAALRPAPVRRDWKGWLLWATLVGGALIVAGFAFSLLRRSAAADTHPG